MSSNFYDVSFCCNCREIVNCGTKLVLRVHYRDAVALHDDSLDNDSLDNDDFVWWKMLTSELSCHL